MIPATGVNLLPTVTCVSAALPQVPLTLTLTRSSTAHQDPKGIGYCPVNEYLQSAAYRAASPGMPVKDREREREKNHPWVYSLMSKREERRKEERNYGREGKRQERGNGAGREEGQGMRRRGEKEGRERETDLMRSRGEPEWHPSSLLLFPQGLSASAPLPAAVGPWRLLRAGFAN